MKLKKSIISLALVCLLASCTNYSLVSTGDNVARPIGWTESTHSNNVTPDYNMVFPQDKVARMDITIDAKDWKLMQDNMTELFGDPATRANRMPGGNQMRNPMVNASGSPQPIPSGSPNPSGIPMPQFSPGAGGQPPLGMNRPMGGGGGGNLQFSEEDPIYKPATVSFEGKTWNYVGIRFKGNSSLNGSWGRTLKLPFRLDFDEFENNYPSVKNQRFYGFKKLSLSSGFSDDSLIREKVTADIFREAGVPSAKTAFYRLYINYGEGSKYFGLYAMVEMPDKPMFQTQFKKDGGNLYKPEGNGAKFGTFDQESFAKKTNEDSSDWADIKSIFTALHADRTNAEQWRAGLEKVFDVKGFLKYLAVNTVIQNWDTYGAMSHNYYLYTDPGDGLVHWIPWDNNMALSGNGGGGMFGGNIPNNIVPQPTVSAVPQPTASAPDRPQGFMGGGEMRGASLDFTGIDDSWPLIRFLYDDPVYKAQYIAFVEETSKGVFTLANSQTRFQKAHDLIKNYVVGSEGEQAGYTLLNSTQAFESSVNSLITHVETRQTAVTTYLESVKK